MAQTEQNEITLKLTKEEFHMVEAAMAICTPSGGGSDLFTLLGKLAGQAQEQGWYYNTNDSRFARYHRFADTVIDDAEEAGVCTRNEGA